MKNLCSSDEFMRRSERCVREREREGGMESKFNQTVLEKAKNKSACAKLSEYKKKMVYHTCRIQEKVK
jgi:hypothetical protein